MNNKKYDIAVVGGGASGMTAAITAARLGADVIVIEKNDQVGKKLLATGNGRCNFTNTEIGKGQYFSDGIELLVPLLSGYGTADAVSFFESLGIVSYENKDGGCYPYSNRAKDVKDCFDAALRKEKVTVRCNTSVRKIAADAHEDGFVITAVMTGDAAEKNATGNHTGSKGGPDAGRVTVSASACILATGGMAAPKSGSTGDGYYYAKSFGHTIIEPHPALVGLVCADKIIQQLAGLRTKATVSLLVDGRPVREEYGEVQFNKDGLSGIPVMSLSRLATDSRMAYNTPVLSLNLFPPTMDEEESMKLLAELVSVKGRGKSVFESLCGLLADKLRAAVLSKAGINKDAAAKGVTACELGRLHRTLCGLSFPVTGSKGYDAAQATAGGIPLDEVDMGSFASLKQDGLYLCGELLDVDGICGGYNLHFAWASGEAAGRAAAREAKEKRRDIALRTGSGKKD